MDGAIAYMVPAILFMLIVAPTWIFMHYRGKQQALGSLSANERTEIETLQIQAERMIDRIDTLESILDSETPEWRKRDRAAEHRSIR